MRMGEVTGFVSEIDCIKQDTTGFSTRREDRWLFEKDSMLLEFELPYGRAYYYKLNTSNDTITMVDNHYMFYDTLLVTRLDADYLIVASIKQLPPKSTLKRKSVMYKRRK